MDRKMPCALVGPKAVFSTPIQRKLYRIIQTVPDKCNGSNRIF